MPKTRDILVRLVSPTRLLRACTHFSRPLRLAARLTARRDLTLFSRRERILVLTPHPDDESLGCGGTIHIAVQHGCTVVVACVTDGRFGNSGAPLLDPAAIARVRATELHAATEVLGGPHIAVVHLGFPDQSLARNAPQTLDAALATLLDRYHPTVVFSTSPLDPHTDHAAVGAAARRVLAARDIRYLEYFIWGWVTPLQVLKQAILARDSSILIRPTQVPLGAAAATKRRSLACYKSQTATTEFVKRFMGSRELFFELTQPKRRCLKPSPTPHTPPLHSRRRNPTNTRGVHAKEKLGTVSHGNGLRSPRSVLSSAQSLWREGLLRDSVFLIAIAVATSLVGYVFWVVAARTYNPDQIGMATATIAVVSLASIVAELGLRYHVVQQLPQEEAAGRARPFIAATMRITVASSTIAGGTGLLLGALSERALRALLEQPAIAVLVIGGVIITTVGSVLDAALIALGLSKWAFLRNSIGSLGKILFMGLFLLLISRDAGTLILCTVLALMASVVVSGRVLTQDARVRVAALKCTPALPMVRQSIRQQLIALGGFVPVFLLPLEVVARLGAQDTAYFSLTWALAGAAFMVSPSVAGALLANVSRGADLFDQIKKAAIVTGSILVVPMLALGIFAPRFLSLFGRAYAEHGALLLRASVISVIPDAITNFKLSVLRAQKRYGAAAVLNGGMALITIVVAWFLLPRLGIAACGIVWLLSQSAGSLWVGWDSVRRSGARLSGPGPSRLGKVLASREFPS